MKNDGTKFVNIHTGEIVTPAWIVEKDNPMMASGKQRRMYFADQMTQKGVPDSRKQSTPIGLSRWMPNHPIYGQFVPLDFTIEQGAIPIRDEIHRLERELSQAKTRLMEYYAAVPGNLDMPASLK